MTENGNPPDLNDVRTNPFLLIAYLLFKVRHSLEDVEEVGRPPRWVRIARAREAQGQSDVIGQGVKTVVNGFAEALSYMVELTLDIQEVLVQTDAAKALLEVSVDLVKAATSKEFTDGITALVGEQLDDNPLREVNVVMQDIKKHMGYIPDPDDVHAIGRELYRLLCIEQKPLFMTKIPKNVTDAKIEDLLMDENEIPNTTSDHLVIDKCGKVRLMQWAFGAGTATYGLGDKAQPEGAGPEELFRFGSRRLWRPSGPGKLPKSTVVLVDVNKSQEKMVEFFFDDRDKANSDLDIQEAYNLLEKLGYTEPAPDETSDKNGQKKKSFGAGLEGRLRRFQVINGLPRTGQLDNHTINRLMHLDVYTGSIERARPFDPTKIPSDIDDPQVRSASLLLVNPDADHYGKENIEICTKPAGYPYYVAGALLPASGSAQVPSTGGWIRDALLDSDDRLPDPYDHRPDRDLEPKPILQGFVGLKSRDRRETASRFDGGRLSAGEAASGTGFFFVARSVDPWEAGRSGDPNTINMLFVGDRPPSGAFTRMYQWVKVDWLVRLVPADYKLQVTASVFQRSLYTDRSKETGMPDRGRISIEFYNSDGFTGDLGSRRNYDKRIDRKKYSAEWFPPRGNPIPPDVPADEIARKRKWLRRHVTAEVPRNATAICVMLEGKLESGWNIDAYFDDVQLRWEVTKEGSSG